MYAKVSASWKPVITLTMCWAGFFSWADPNTARALALQLDVQSVLPAVR